MNCDRNCYFCKNLCYSDTKNEYYCTIIGLSYKETKSMMQDCGDFVLDIEE